MFKVGDYVVYKRDVCRIVSIKTFHEQLYYVMHPMDDDTLTISVPADNESCHLRSVISKVEAENLIQKIHSIPLLETTNRLAEHQYKILLQSGNLEDLICIIKTCYLRNDDRKKNGKKIGEIDDTYFKLAEKILYNELSISLGRSFEETRDYVNLTVKRLCE